MAKTTRSKKITANPFNDLTWMDIQEWAGSKIVSRGKSYQRSGYVSSLGITNKNELIAWVEGTTRYATKVWFKRNKLTSECTCPYGFNCKHGVAVVIEYLEAVKTGKKVSEISSKDKRLVLIKEGETFWPNDTDDDPDFYDDNETDYHRESPPKRSENRQDSVDIFLKGKTRNELITLIKEIAADNFDVQTMIAFKAKINSRSVTTLVKTVKREIDKATAEPGWWDGWNHTGEIPDYSKVKSGLQKLYEMEKYDEIVNLGKILIKKGSEQVEESDDEGKTHDELADTLSVVYKALPKSSLSGVQKIECAINWEMDDDFSLTDGLDSFWKIHFDKQTWSSVADLLLKNLDKTTGKVSGNRFSRDYRRDFLTNHIITALERSDRTDEQLALCMREAPVTKSYDRLVSLLLKQKKTIEAEEWIRKGIRDTADDYSGIASGLREKLLQMYTKKRNVPFCAALKSDMYFERPNLDNFKQLEKACKKARVWNNVRPAIITYLNTGRIPEFTGKAWPLPDTGLFRPAKKSYDKPPYIHDLIKIALYEKNIDEVLRLYDGSRKSKSGFSYGYGSGLEDEIADVIKVKYPERSIAMWKIKAERHIDRTSPSEYEVAVAYLNRILKVSATIKKKKECMQYIESLRVKNKRKRRLLEMLNGLTGKRIIDE